MSLEVMLLISASVLFLISLLFIPKANRGQAQLVFLFVQFPTWILGLMAVEAKLLEYPIHELSRANSTSFIFEYLILPIYCIHFISRYPANASKITKILYYCGASALLTIAEVVVEKYTDILEYTGWTWYITFFSVLFILWLSRAVTKWFFKKAKTSSPEISGK